IFAANLTAFLTYPLCAIAMYLLARRFVGRPAALVAGFFYAFCLRRDQSLPHLHMLGVHYLPLVLLLAQRSVASARLRAAVLRAPLPFYSAYALALAYGPYLAGALYRWRAPPDRRRVIGLLATAAVALAALFATSTPYLRLQALGLIPSYGDDDQEMIGLVPY